MPVEAKVEAILWPTWPDFAHAGDDDAALRGADQVDCGGESRAKPVAQRGGQRIDAAAFGIERAQRRIEIACLRPLGALSARFGFAIGKCP